MAAFPKLDTNKKDVKLEDLRTHTNIQHKALNEIGQLLKQVALNSPGLVQLDQDTIKLFDTIDKTTDNAFLKRVIQEYLANYPNSFPTVEGLEVSNRNWQAEQLKTKREQRLDDKVKIHSKPRRVDGSGETLMYSYEKNKHIIVKYEGQLTKDQYSSEIVEYLFQGKRVISKIPSFFRFLNFSKQIGIPLDEIYKVLHMFTQLCLPEKIGMITHDSSMLNHNINIILDSLDLEDEKRK